MGGKGGGRKDAIAPGEWLLYVISIQEEFLERVIAHRDRPLRRLGCHPAESISEIDF